MRAFIATLIVAVIYCPPAAHVPPLDSINTFVFDDGSEVTRTADDPHVCTSHARHAAAIRSVTSADFHYGLGGLLAATSDLAGDYIDEIDAAMTLPMTQLALLEDLK